MPKVTHKQIADVFKAAQKHLSTTMYESPTGRKKPWAICAALGRVRHDNSAVHAATDIVNERLSGYLYFHGWLADKVGWLEVSLDRRNNKGRRIQAARLAWLKSLEKEFSKKKK